MTTTRRPDELVDILGVDLQRRYEPNFAWGQAMGMLLLPQLRGFWPMSSVDEGGQVYDLTGQGRTLTDHAGIDCYHVNLIPYSRFSSAASQYFSRADEAGLDITGSLTLGCWVMFVDAAGSNEVIYAKSTGAPQMSWQLERDAGGTISFSVSHDCSNWVTATSTTTPGAGLMDSGPWYFLWGRFKSFGTSSQVDVGINRDYWSQATTTATICNSNAPLTLGVDGGLANYANLRATLFFLCERYFSDSLIWNVFEQTRAMFGE